MGVALADEEPLELSNTFPFVDYSPPPPYTLSDSHLLHPEFQTSSFTRFRPPSLRASRAKGGVGLDGASMMSGVFCPGTVALTSTVIVPLQPSRAALSRRRGKAPRHLSATPASSPSLLPTASFLLSRSCQAVMVHVDRPVPDGIPGERVVDEEQLYHLRSHLASICGLNSTRSVPIPLHLAP